MHGKLLTNVLTLCSKETTKRTSASENGVQNLITYIDREREIRSVEYKEEEESTKRFVEMLAKL
ncbi:hypothetical protein bcgnr5372_26370 [Bacillus luti]|nr:hypothetical protein [Bacillus cereus]HDR8329427.1 hypothetical protein [Bacillus cereus]HDR8335969.1 hypothetical protein [Bacillus cereus]